MLADLLNEVFYGGDFGTGHFPFGYVPLSVEVFSCEVRPVVPEDHPVNVDHRYHINHVILQQKLSLFALAQQPVDNSFADERSLTLARVLSGHYKYGFSGIFFFAGGWVGDDQALYDPFAEGFSDCHSSDYFFVFVHLFNEMLMEFFCGVGVGVGDIEFVVIEEG